jgi:hypothetical protein
VLNGLLLRQSYLVHRTLPADASVRVGLAEYLTDKQTPVCQVCFADGTHRYTDVRTAVLFREL